MLYIIITDYSDYLREKYIKVDSLTEAHQILLEAGWELDDNMYYFRENDKIIMEAVVSEVTFCEINTLPGLKQLSVQ